MRFFASQAHRLSPLRRLAAVLVVLAAMGAFVDPDALSAQFPGEIRGRVLDAATRSPVAGAAVTLEHLALSAVTDGSGVFVLRGVEKGRQRLTIRRLGYLPSDQVLVVRNGAAARPVVLLIPRPLDLAELDVQVDRSMASGQIFLDRRAIESTGARTAAELVENLPGVVVRRRGRGSAATPSIRGSGANAVLVLVDGAPLNDPISGEADLSLVPSGSIESLTVFRGSQSARYGARAQGGAIVIQSRSASPGLAGRFRTGALGEASGSADWGTSLGGTRLGLGAEVRSLAGSFGFERPPEVGGGRGQRANADLDQQVVRASLRSPLLGGEGRLTVGYEGLGRGLPGRSFAPSESARQSVDRARFGADWRRQTSGLLLGAVGYGTRHSARFSDPAPPLGLPYDDRTELQQLGGRLSVEGHAGGLLRAVGGGLDIEHQRIDSQSLTGAPVARTDMGAYLNTALTPLSPGRSGGASLRLDLALRADRAGIGGTWRASHDAALTYSVRRTRVRISHSSSFSPPSLGDQFFREGVAVEPNPGLRAERVPGEFEIGADVSGSMGGLEFEIGAEAYTGDLRDMIVWLPDFRFIWSPRNIDVQRSGGAVWGEISLPATGLRLAGQLSRDRVTYDRPASDSVQVVYRPRHSASLSADWAGSWLSLHLAARYLGLRYPVAAPLNGLPGFWSFDLSASRRWSWSGWQIEPSLRLERLFDSKDNLIFAYPDPGRTASVEVRVRKL
ncbi:MAG: TonB-dependent receptor plug domain-containing protein [Gemmatimonadota bacterium]